MNINAWNTHDAPKIDGILDDEVWSDPLNMTNLTASLNGHYLNNDEADKYIYEGYFTQNWPNNNQPSRQKTRLQVAYDDYAIYVSAQLYDTAPDSVRTNLGGRDSGSGAADSFIVSFDTYNKQQDCFEFEVTAAGVQSDRMRGMSGWDGNWNEVWQSAVQKNEEGWAVEMAIPYRALRMPNAKEMVWGVNFGRVIKRSNETAFWNNVDAEKQGYVNQFGSLRGLYDIKPPLRLTLSPYISNVAVSKQGSDKIANTFSGGADLKLGLGQSFTLDVSLVPDFSQVQADNEVLNLSAYEVQYGEFRDFFRQGTSIFNKWGQFYSRRIGQSHVAPSDDHLQDNEEFIFKPNDAPLINSIKLTGRTEKGLGVGILNSITNVSYAIIEDTLTNETRTVEADPLTNFNIISVDQNLPNNSSIGVINTNVRRGQGHKSSNVSSGHFNLYDRNNMFRFRGFGALSQEFNTEVGNNGEDERLTTLGHRFDLGHGKVSGNWHYWVSTNVESDTYNPNDLGYNSSNNAIQVRANTSWNQYKGKGIYQRYWVRVGYNEDHLYAPKAFMYRNLWGDADMLFNNFWSVRLNAAITPQMSYDYFGPREEGYRFAQYPSHDTGVTLNSDGSKRYSISMRASIWQRQHFNQLDDYYRYGQTYRVNDKWDLNHQIAWSQNRNEKGYVTTEKDESDNVEAVIYGDRNVKTLENNFWTQYTFNNKMFLKLRLRHYWRQVAYDEFFDLAKSGELLTSDFSDVNEDGEKEHDANYNTFNMEVSYSWEFLPGSFVTAMWRNELGSNSHNSHYNFTENVNEMWKEAQVNTLSVRLMYFLDYQQVKRGIKSM
ncbi:DUF5916 domain-containing protein [Flammeovirga sp. SubArs3]|uniref:DUF5916 domain-containing protein n=1 Tax=Flammeovirga sp. SubArs3 TaxID=2995316 RepID=UPI00248CC1E9|nr:DUF5916 domain-containing protein [Flammeovirga sp. SubArs3]